MQTYCFLDAKRKCDNACEGFNGCSLPFGATPEEKLLMTNCKLFFLAGAMQQVAAAISDLARVLKKASQK